MTREEILSMALDAGFMISTQYGQKSKQPMPVSDSATLEKFAALVAAKERQECAQFLHERYMELEHGTDRTDPSDDYEYGIQSEIIKELRDKIRAIGNPV